MITEDKVYTYYVSPAIGLRHEDGFHYYPAIVIENESGYYLTDWDWGTDLKLAEQACEEINARQGRDKETSDKIVMSSMFAK